MPRKKMMPALLSTGRKMVLLANDVAIRDFQA